MIDLANPKTPLDSAKIAGYLAIMSRRHGACSSLRNCPYPSSSAFAEAFKEGVEYALTQPPIEKGEMFDLGHYSGIKCSVCFDDIEIGDPIVMICKMYGLLVQSADHNPKLVKGELTKVDGCKSGVLLYHESGTSDKMFKTDAVSGGWHQSYALRYIG